MNKTEAITILSVLKTAYPAAYRDLTRRDAEAMAELWAAMFREEPVELVALGVKAFIAGDQKGFPPHIGAIKAQVAKLTRPAPLTEAQAWALISRAISRGIYHAGDAFQGLPEPLRQLVGSPRQLRDWALMEPATVQSVVASNVQRAYRAHLAREEERVALPGDVAQALSAAGALVPVYHGTLPDREEE